MVEILENVRGKDVFVLQSTCAPTNDKLMELMIMVDALRRSSAARITAAIPYFGYARQDRRPRTARVAITAKVVANMLTAVGVDRVLTMDLHADQIQGFFDIPVDNVYATPILLGDVWKHGYKNLVVVSPDVGGVVRARAHREAPRKRPRDHRQAPPAAQRRHGDEHHRRGEGPHLRDHGRHGRHREHAVRGGAGAEGERRRAGASPTARTRCSRGRRSSASRLRCIDELVVTDTIPLRPMREACTKIRQISVAELLAETMRRICEESSVSSLFVE